MPSIHCPLCTCIFGQDHGAHALLAALRENDLDAALALGLLEAEPCPGCSDACTCMLVQARDARRFALAARARHRARAWRLARIQTEREAARRATPPPVVVSENSRPHTATDLPKAASDALANALARARGRHS